MTKQEQQEQEEEEEEEEDLAHQQLQQQPEKAIWIEIISCRDLPIGDRSTQSSDPYVKVKREGQLIHETKPILQT